MKSWKIKFCFFIVCILLFTFIYCNQLKGLVPDDELLTEAFYQSILTQTLTGSSTPPPNKYVKRTVMIQALLGFCFVSGFIIYFIKNK